MTASAPKHTGGVDASEESEECGLYTLMQYKCRPLKQGEIGCQPIERVFRKCKHRPAVEVTHVVSVDRLGNLYLADAKKNAMPPAFHWHERKSE